MKKIFILFVLFLVLNAMGFSQGNTGNQGLFQPDPNMPAYKPGEILVKFKDDVLITKQMLKGTLRTGIVAIDQLNEKYQVATMTKVFRGTEKMATQRSITMPSGEKRQLAQVFNIYKLVFPITKDAEEAVKDFKALPEVEYAELNGSAAIVGGIPTSEPFSMPESRILHPASQIPDPASRIPAMTPNDPLYPQQWPIPYIKADSLWCFTTGDTTQVVGILDTGIDWLHPDLVHKIWTNTDEIPNNNIDDDNNGFVDDVRGWDFVNDDNNPRDDNSHGTHCAGIAGAEANNGIGIAGVSWGAKIMALKVFQSNGIGYFSQIAEGFWYAAQNGCTIFSNSWMSSGESMTIRLAMEYAYSKGLIVAAAGNMNYKTDLPFPPWPPYEPNYPACYNWVLGVEATDQNGNNTWFSNYDPTGPIISDSRPYGGIYYNDYDYNYEMRAPGVSFISTVPNGQYRSYSGTSMACPLVAGAIALMKSYDTTLSNEQVFAKLIQPIKLGPMQAGVLDILKCTMTNPPPDLYYIKNILEDSIYGGDHDGRADAGETINMHITVKNAGGFGDSIYAKLRFTEFEDTTVARILDSTCYLGSISAYATQTSLDAIKIKIDSNVVDARIISFQLLIYQRGTTDTLIKGLTITVEHGIEIKGTYTKLHLHPGAYYIVTGVAVIDSLIIDPGVTLRFRNTFMMINKYLSAIGNPDSMITFRGADNAFVNGIITTNAKNEYRYCIFQDGLSGYLTNPKKIYNCIFRLNGQGYNEGLFNTYPGGDYKYNVFVDNIDDNGHAGIIRYTALSCFKYNIIASNIAPHTCPGLTFGGPQYPQCMDSTTNNVLMNNEKYDCSATFLNGWPMGIYKMKENYWGTTNIEQIKAKILDFYEEQSRPVLEPDTILSSPPSQCHGVTWKVEINDQNPQNTPLVIGTGPARFSVYFNRPMDTTLTPFLTFGVRFPFTQNNVSDSARWSADHKVWTAYKTIDMSTGDGQNTIRVAYAKDLEHFEIPIERSRFKFVVQAASSQSVEFIATPGVGKVSLEWPPSDSSSVLGYNMYRFTMPTPSTFSDTILINSTLITDSVYADFAVIPGTTYYYLFTVLRTDLSESDYSKVVNATPLIAANGDANGDHLVNVLDITTVISYMLNQNPQPFMFDAADVNNDNTIDILDVIGIVNLINGKKKAGSIFTGVNPDPAYIWLDSNSITFRSQGQVAAMQFELTGKNLEEIELICKQNGFEFAQSMVKGKLMGIIYNLENRTLPDGMLNLINIEGIANPLKWGNVTAGDAEGNKVIVYKGLKGELLSTVTDLQAFPNPSRESVTITYFLSEPETITLSIFNNNGQLMQVLDSKEREAGVHSIVWNGKDAPAGIYFCRLNGKTKAGKELNNEIKIVLMK